MQSQIVFDNQLLVALVISLIGLVGLIIVAIKTTGIGDLTLRAYGIILIGTIVSVLALMMKETNPVIIASMSILGAIVGYLFGFKV